MQLVTLLALVGVVNGFVQEKNVQTLAKHKDQRFAWVDDLFSDRDARGIAGAACVIVQRNRVIHIQGYGVENRSANQPIDPHRTRFYLASVTKAFTATLVLRLVDKGLLDLDQDISRYLGAHPKLKKLPESKPITLRHLLTHTAGFDDRNIGMAVHEFNQIESLGNYLSRVLPPQIRPAGEITMYDNHGWALAGLIAERVSDRSYPDLLQTEIFDPLGMNNSTVRTPNVKSNLAEPYITRRQGEAIVWKKVIPSYRMTTPAGCIWSTASDMSRFLLMHLKLGSLEDGRYLSRISALEMQTSSWLPQPGTSGLTAGFWERNLSGKRVLLIVGAAPEGASLVALVPELEFGVFMAASRKDASYLTPKLSKILARLTPGDLPAVEKKVIAGWDQRSSQIPGEYYLLRFSARTLETLAKWQAWIRFEVIGPGTIQTTDSSGDTRIYHEVSENVFRQNGKPGFLALKSDPKGKLLWATTTDGFGFGDGLGFPNSFQKAAWYERVDLKRTILLLSMLIFVIEIIGWPFYKLASWLIGIRRKSNSVSSHNRTRGVVLPWLTAVCGLTGLLGVAMILANQDHLVFGMPTWSVVPCWAILLFVLLTPCCCWITVKSWAGKKWTVTDRLFASLVTFSSVILVPFLYTWNLIGLTYSM